MTVKKTVFSALLAVMSLTLYIVEGMIPPVVAIPGFRIGLAYFPVLFSLYLGGRWKAYDTALILIARILLSALVSGNITALLFSLCGGAPYAVVCRNGGHAPFYKRSVGSIPCRNILGGDA